MKKVFTFLFVFVMVLGLSLQAHAALANRGTDINGNRLIYDSDLNITWYDYTRWGEKWWNQVYWADALSVTFGSNTYTDWRLPTTVDGPYVYGYNGNTTGGFNITSSEMGHLFYTELGNKGYCDTSGNCPQSGWGLTNTGDFQNLLNGYYWSGTEYAADLTRAWYFNTYDGNQDRYDNKGVYNKYALAVRPGDVAVAVAPEPMSMVLFGVGGVVMAARRKFFKMAA